MGRVLSVRRKIVLENDLTYSDIKYNNRKKEEQIKKCKKEIKEAMKSVLNRREDGGFREVVYVYKKQSFYMRATPPTVIKYIKNKILPYCDPKSAAESLIENYSGKRRDYEYFHILHIFQRNREVALYDRSEKIKHRFKDFLKLEDEKLEKENEFGGEWLNAERIYTSSPNQGSYFRELIKGNHGEIVKNVDDFYKSNQEPLHVRLNKKKELEDRYGKLYYNAR